MRTQKRKPRTLLTILVACGVASCTSTVDIESVEGLTDAVEANELTALPAESWRRVIREPGLPEIYAFVEAQDRKVINFVRRALEGLRLEGDSAPSPKDRVFMGHHYLAWVDQTGFVGKVNGLWRLNGKKGGELDFVLTDGNRPVNFLVVGERGNGAWPEGYAGSEHVELPNQHEEDRSCEGAFCAQYGHFEANPVTGANGSWRACNRARPGWNTLHRPIEATQQAEGWQWMYQDALVKIADFDGRSDGDRCGEDWVFEDGVRRRVWLQLGYRFYTDRPFLDRFIRIVNPPGNPPVNSRFGTIGGFVITDWSDPHPLKHIGDFWRLGEEASRPRELCYGSKQGDGCNGDSVVLNPGAWVRVAKDRGVKKNDVLIGWLGAPLSLSVAPRFVRGRSATIQMIQQANPGDVGACLCVAHGGIEMGGGGIGGGRDSLFPLAGGQSAEAIRRLTIH